MDDKDSAFYAAGVSARARGIFFHSLGGRDDWTREEKDAFWSKYDDTDVSLAYETGAI